MKKATSLLIFFIVSIFVFLPFAAFATQGSPGGEATDKAVATQKSSDKATATPKNTEKPSSSPKSIDKNTAKPDSTGGTKASPTNGSKGVTVAELDLPEGVTPFDGSQLTIKHTMLIEAESGKVLFSTDNADEKIFPASTTKLMTALIFFESNPDLSTKVTITKDAIKGFYSGSSLMKLKENEEVSLNDLVHGMLMISGNDAASAIAIYTGETLEGFVEKMNDKAAELGMSNTHFVNAHGVHKEEHFSTLNDFAKLAAACFKNEQIMKICSNRQYKTEGTKQHPSEVIYNSNKLLSDEPKFKANNYSNANGMKTGLTDTAGGCLVASAEKDGLSLITLQFGDMFKNPDDGKLKGDKRWPESTALFKYGFDQYARVDIAPALKSLRLSNSMNTANEEEKGSETLEMEANIPPELIVFDSKKALEEIQLDPSKIQIDQQLDGQITAPISIGQKLGQVSFSYGGQELYTGELIATKNIEGSGETITDASGKPVSLPTVQPNGGLNLLWLLLIPLAIVLVIIIWRIFRSREEPVFYDQIAERKAAREQRSHVERKPVQRRKPERKPSNLKSSGFAAVVAWLKDSILFKEDYGIDETSSTVEGDDPYGSAPSQNSSASQHVISTGVRKKSDDYDEHEYVQRRRSVPPPPRRTPRETPRDYDEGNYTQRHPRSSGITQYRRNKR